MSPKRPGQPTAAIGPEQAAIEERLRKRLPRLLVAEREARGWTQETLAERAGVHWTTVGKLERGKQIPSLAVLILLAKAMEMPLLELVDRTVELGATPPGDDTVSFVQALPRADRRRLLPLLRMLFEWKAGR